MNRKIGGCVVLYNPDAGVVSNIQTYCYGLDLLFVIDNSPVKDMALVEKITGLSEKIRYSWMGENIGLASALNHGCRLAVSADCNWLLTMDQDSHFPEQDLVAFIRAIEPIEEKYGKVGIIAPIHLVSEHFVPSPNEDYSDLRFTMTSGNLLNLQAGSAIGPFEEKLFIDCVDMDYCLRLRKAGYKVIQDNSARLIHSLGEFETRKLLGKKIGTSNHSPVRRYYITRNKIYVLKKYYRFDPVFCWLVIRSMAGNLLRIVFFEKDKWLKLRAISRGARHAFTNHYGKL